MKNKRIFKAVLCSCILILCAGLHFNIAKAEMADTEMADTEMADTEMADTEMADTEMADTEMADTEMADTEMADTETADMEIADTETADTETADMETADTEAADTETENAELDYVLGRPMTKQEIEDQKTLEPNELPAYSEEDDIVPRVEPMEEKSWGARIPSSYDSRSLGVVTPVKNQNPWGTCWAFSVISCAETSLISKHPELSDHLDLSERHLAYFYYHTPPDPLGNAAGDKAYLRPSVDYLMTGGNAESSAFALANWYGFASERTAPYRMMRPSDLDASLAYQQTAYLKNAYWISSKDTDEVKSMILKNGAAMINFYYDQFCFNYHTAAYCGNIQDTNHNITIIGWDDRYSAQNFNARCRPSADGAWLAKNSWGKGWGNGGYFWISYEDASINGNASSFKFYDAEETGDYEHNYHYDGSIGNGVVDFQNEVKIASIYKAQAGNTGAEALKAVGFALNSTNVRYSIQVYKNITDTGNPESGTPFFSVPQTGIAAYCGYYTIPLNKYVPVIDSGTFSVVITLTKASGEPISCYVDNTYETKYGLCFYTNESRGQSLYKAKGGTTWADSSLQKSPWTLRLKGFTSDMAPVPAKSVSLRSASMSLKTKEEKQLTAIILPADATDTRISWKSSKPSVAAVDARGRVKAVSPGKCTITAYGANGCKAACPVVVKKTEVKKASGLRVTKAGASSIRFQWKQQSDASGYLVYRYRPEKKKWDLIADLGSRKKNSYTDKKRKNVSMYNYAVIAYVKTNGTRIYGKSSDTLQAYTGTKTPSLKISISRKRAVLRWKKVKGASGYEIFMSSSKNGKYKCVKRIEGNKTASYKRALKKRHYYYKIRTYRKKGKQISYSGYSKTCRA